MIGTEMIEKILKTVLASGKLKDERPLSAFFIAPPECGKTSLFRKYCLKTDNIFYTTDATAYGIIRDSNQLKDFETGRFTHIVIPDLLTCLGRKQSTVTTFIQFMNAFIEEGIVNISTFATNIKERDIEVKVGLITAIPPGPFLDRRRHWERVGFLSRALPISFDYRRSTVVKILTYIQRQEHLKESIEKLELPKKLQTIELSSHMAKMIEPYALSLAVEHSKHQQIYGFRYQRQLQTFAKALAMIEKKKRVDRDCIEELARLAEYINLSFNKI